MKCTMQFLGNKICLMGVGAARPPAGVMPRLCTEEEVTSVCENHAVCAPPNGWGNMTNDAIYCVERQKERKSTQGSVNSLLFIPKITISKALKT